MGALAVSRKQRLRTLENDIRKRAEDIQRNGLEIGRALCEIRDEELWADEYGSWNQYLKERAEELVGKSFAQSAALIRSAEIAKRLPSSMSDHTKDLGATHFQELGRLAPDDPKSRGTTKDYSRLRKPDVARVIKRASTYAKPGKPPSVRDIRKAVDEDLGVNRASKAKETARKRDALPRIEDYLRSQIGMIEAITRHLAKVPADGWELLEESDPGLAERLAAACDELAALLRS